MLLAGAFGASRGAPRFQAAAGWHVLVEPGQTASAANVRFAASDRSQSFPTRTIASLPRRGVLIWIEWGRPRGSSAARLYPRRALPLRVERAARTAAPEGTACPPASPSCAVGHLLARESGWDTDVWIFSGSPRPSSAQLAAIDSELGRLRFG